MKKKADTRLNWRNRHLQDNMNLIAVSPEEMLFFLKKNAHGKSAPRKCGGGSKEASPPAASIKVKNDNEGRQRKRKSSTRRGDPTSAVSSKLPRLEDTVISNDPHLRVQSPLSVPSMYEASLSPIPPAPLAPLDTAEARITAVTTSNLSTALTNASPLLHIPWRKVEFPSSTSAFMRKTFDLSASEILANAYSFQIPVEDRHRDLQVLLKTMLGTIDIAMDSLLHKQTLWLDWIHLQSEVLQDLLVKMEPLLMAVPTSSSSIPQSHMTITDREIRSLLREAYRTYRLKFRRLIWAWYEAHFRSWPDRAVWLLWMMLVAQSAQICIHGITKYHGFKCKVDTLLTPFKFAKMQGLVLELCIMAQVMDMYPCRSVGSVTTTSSAIGSIAEVIPETIPASNPGSIAEVNSEANPEANPEAVCGTFSGNASGSTPSSERPANKVFIGNGTSLARQPKIQRECQQDILQLALRYKELNTSEKKQLAARITQWFDKGEFTFTTEQGEDDS